ncbi:hypothetical protein SEA_PHREDRICK_11 [Streptomyces phage Phredrick]|nr:hypothetical protein SEA_FORREST_12 [Streptomyces phage Forrest]WMI33410.1 hypothetical protein SEA_KENREY_12 [Streptomyces phage Kenrey]WNN94603.1 hypothetical protein SEA_PHREDRICK_11 [Streptomyces phage Phredrick]
MDPIKRVEWLQAQIKSQKKIRAQFLKEKNEIGAARASRKIREHEEELRRLV